MITSSSTVDRVFSPFEVACLDVQGHAAGRPVSDLLGGAVRDAVPYSAYLFYKWASHPGGEPDSWGEALDPDAIVAQARRIIDEYGFNAIKLKGGVFPPEQEIAAIQALREEFPDQPLRLDPNAVWTRRLRSGRRDSRGWWSTSRIPRQKSRAWRGRQGGAHAAGDQHVCGRVRSARSRRQTVVPVVLSDHHYWGGLQRTTAGRHLRHSVWACRCTPTPTSASASPP